MTALLDANVLIALLIDDHVHHDAAADWFTGDDARFATCPITEGSLVRMLIRHGEAASTAQQVIAAVTESERHEFWPDTIAYPRVRMAGVVGHRQVTDAYLAELARANNGRLATFDQGLAELHRDVADLVPVR